MKVLIVSEPGLDGVFRCVEGLIRYLLNHGHEVLYAWSDRRTSDRLFELVAEVEKRGGETLRLSVGNAPCLGDLNAVIRLATFARRHRPELIHAHSSKAGVLARALPLFGVKAAFIYTPHAYYKMHEPAGFKTGIFHLIEAIFGRVGWTGGVSPTEAEFAVKRLRLPAKRLMQNENGVDPGRFIPVSGEEKLRLRKEFEIPSQARVLGTIGRLSPQKDPLTMYRAIAMAAQEDRDLFLFHLGNGEFEKEVNALVREQELGSRVKRLPYLADPRSFYRCLDGFILTSLYEGMSFALIEAIAMNLPLIVTRAPGNEHFADFGLSHIYWADSGNPASVADAIRRWHHDRAASAVPNHREVTIRSLSEEKCYGRLVQFYERTVNLQTPVRAASPHRK